MWIASKEGHLEAARALVAAGADLSIASVSTMLVTVSILIILPLSGGVICYIISRGLSSAPPTSSSPT